jgi:hypothetical protein
MKVDEGFVTSFFFLYQQAAVRTSFVVRRQTPASMQGDAATEILIAHSAKMRLAVTLGNVSMQYYIFEVHHRY